MYSDSELTENDSYSESDDEDDEESDAINSIDECDEAPEGESNNKVLHDIDANIFLQQFRTMCQRKIQTWEKYRERNIVEYTKNKDERKKRRESIIDTSKRTIQDENITTGGCSMIPLKNNMQALAIETGPKNYGTPKKQIHNHSMDWEKSRTHKTKDVTKRADAITEEINATSMQQFGQQMRKYVKNDIAQASDNDEMHRFITVNTSSAIKSSGLNGVNGVAEEMVEMITTTTTTTKVKKLRRVSMLPSLSTLQDVVTLDSDLSSDAKVKKRYNIDSNDECPITPKKQQLTSNGHKACSMRTIVLSTPRRPTTISKATMTKKFLAEYSNEDDIDTSGFRDVRVDKDETLKIALPKTPRSLNTPVKRSKMIAIDQTPHKEVEKKRDILSTILSTPRANKPIIIREK